MGTNNKPCCNDLLAPRYKLQPVMDSIYIAEGQNLKFGSVVDCKGFLCGSTHLEPYAILYEDCDTTNGAQEANVLIMGEFNIEKLVFGADATGDVLDKIVFYAKKNGIIIRPYDYAPGFTPTDVSSIEKVIPEGTSSENKLVDQETINTMSTMHSTVDIDLNNEWESGYFVAEVPTASQYGWRTKNFYDCTDINFDTNSAVVHINNADYKFVLVIFDSEGTYVNTSSTGGTTTDLTPSDFGANRKYKIYITRVDGTKITSLSDDEANAICYIEKKNIVVSEKIDNVDELLGIVEQKIENAINDDFPFEVKKIAFIGDSFTTLNKYTKKVVEFLGLASDSYRNYGISGYGIVDFIANNKKSWVGGMADCQVATLWIGTNDFAQEQLLGDFDSSDTSTFTGALRDFLSWWTNTSAFDNQLKLIITPTQRWGYNSDTIPNPTMTNGLGITLSQYTERLKDVAHDYGIAVLDMYNESGISALALDDGKAKFTTDGLHPTTSYFDRLGIRIAKAIKNKCV